MGNEQAKSEVATGFGIQSMDQQLQRKFSKGIQFNMKIVIKGDRNSGKSCLFKRLQGKAFEEAYIPTDEIQVSSILWSYKETQDTVKVEVWDVVDKGKTQKKKKQGKLKMFNDPEVQDPINQPLDAQFLDVYKGTHGVIFVFDMTKQWTYQYVTRELPLVPYHIPIIVLGNFRDMGEHRVISNLEAVNFIELLERPEGSADVRYAECSMKDGFGLKYLHKFFSIPFLHLQQESLLQQLQVNRELLVSTIEELTIDENSEDNNYELFKEAIAQRLKQREKRLAEEKAAAAAAAMANTEEQSTDDKGKETTTQPSPAPVVEQQPPPDTSKRSSFRAKLSQRFSTKKGSPVAAKKEQKKETPSRVTKTTGGKGAVANIDDFVPDEDIDTNFLTEEGDEEHNKLYKNESDDSDDDIAVNPLVAGDEDIDSEEEDEPEPDKPVAMVANTKPVTDDEEEKDDDEEQRVPLTSAEQQKRSPEPVKQQKASPKPTEQHKTSPKPVQPVKPVAPRPVLLSAKSVELTESSSEEDDNEAEQLVQTRKKQPIKPSKETSAPSPKFSGLKLEHSLPSSAPPKKTEPPKEEIAAVKEKESSASITKEEKKSKSKRKKHKEEANDKEHIKLTISPVATAATTDAADAVNDPFSSSLLDAWLDSPTGDPLAPILQPSTVRKPDKVNVDQTAEATTEEQKKKHKHKKHKHKHKHSAETTAGGEKKKQKHSREHSTTTESSEPAGNDYVALL